MMSLEKKISSVKAFLTGEEGDENFIFFRHLHLEGRKTNKPPEGQKPRSQEQSWEGIFEGWGWSSWNQQTGGEVPHGTRRRHFTSITRYCDTP